MADYPNTPVVSAIKLPSGNPYYVKDADARAAIDELEQQIAGGMGFKIVWTQTDWASSTAPTSAKLATIPKDVTIHYNSGASTATGTLAAGASTLGNFYLVYSNTQIGSQDYYNEYATISENQVYKWEKIGDTQVDLTGVVTDVAVTTPKSTTNVIGSSASFSFTDSQVEISSGSTGDVTVATGINSATATGGGAAWNSKDSKTVVTSYPGVTGSAASSVTPTTKKLATTTVTGVSGSTNITPVESRSSQTTVSGFTAATTANYDSDNDILKGASVSNEVLILGAYKPSTQTTYSAGAPRASLAVPTAASSATTVATGSTTTSGSGADIVTDVEVGDTVTVLTGLGTPNTATVVGTSATFTNTQPTITVTPTTTKLSATASNGVVSWNSKDQKTVLTDVALTVTKGTNSGE